MLVEALKRNGADWKVCLSAALSLSCRCLVAVLSLSFPPPFRCPFLVLSTAFPLPSPDLPLGPEGGDGRGQQGAQERGKTAPPRLLRPDRSLPGLPPRARFLLSISRRLMGCCGCFQAKGFKDAKARQAKAAKTEAKEARQAQASLKRVQVATPPTPLSSFHCPSTAFVTAGTRPCLPCFH